MAVQLRMELACGDGAAVLKLWADGADTPMMVVVPDGQVAPLNLYGGVRDLYVADGAGRPGRYLIYDGFPHDGAQVVWSALPAGQ